MTPQEVLMNCLADAERIKDIVIIVHTNDACYENWSNQLEIHERLGLVEVIRTRMKKKIEEFVDDKD